MSDTVDGGWRAWTERRPLRVDAEALFTHLYADDEIAVWLDSAQTAYGMGRWSILGAPDGGRADVRDFASGDDPWTAVAHDIAARPVAPIPGLPFAGGWVGWIGYGAKDIGAPAPAGEPIAQLVRLSRFVVVDHREHVVHAVAVGPEADAADGRAWLDRTLARIAACPPAPAVPPSPSPVAATSSVDRTRYGADLDEVRTWLEAGDSYEACYTYALRVPVAEEPLGAYRRLRRANPAPYAAFLRLPGRSVLSCSPERYLAVAPDGRAETKPIKGTARRVDDPVGDAAAARALAADPKTRAENLMIVDLLRNDLGRVSAPGSVEVPDLMAVESYATVHQLVTVVRSRLLPGPAAGVRAAQALFPPGSMTGAPKRRTVELLDRLEAAPRGVYSGVLGFFSRCGAVDLSVVIRTAVIRDGEAVIGTGGAITFDSVVASEADETVAKSAALLRVFGARHPFPSRTASASQTADA
ncbi:anthranilate synthase component I family protein [Microbacterium sp. NPDC055683]